jgi:uncharacterized membrane protein
VAPDGEGRAIRLRFLVRLALAILILDTGLLLTAGVFSRQALPFVLAGITILLAVGVLLLQRRFSRRWEEISAARQELKSEVKSWSERKPQV